MDDDLSEIKLYYYNYILLLSYICKETVHV